MRLEQATASDTGFGALRRARQVGPALVDQVLSSGTQFLAAILITRVASPELFGTASAVLLLQGLLLGTVRALVGDVTLLRCRRPGSDVQREADLGVSLAGVLGILYAGGLLLASGFADGDLGELLLVIAVVMPFCCLQDVLRSVAYGRRRVIHAVWLDAVWMTVQVGLSAALFIADEATAWSLLVAWGAGAVVSGVGGAVVGGRKPAFRGLRGWLAEDGRRSVAFLVDYTVNSGVLMVATLLLAFIMPPAEYGSLRLARVSIVPLLNLIAGVRSLMLGRLSELGDDAPAARHLAVYVGRLFAAAMIAYGVVITFMPTSVGELLFGGGWDDARPLVGIMALAEVFRFSSIPAVDVVRVFGSPRELVRTRVWTSVLLAGVVLGAGSAFGASGVVWGMLVVLVVSAQLWWSLALKLTRTTERTSAAP